MLLHGFLQIHGISAAVNDAGVNFYSHHSGPDDRRSREHWERLPLAWRSMCPVHHFHFLARFAHAVTGGLRGVSEVLIVTVSMLGFARSAPTYASPGYACCVQPSNVVMQDLTPCFPLGYLPPPPQIPNSPAQQRLQALTYTDLSMIVIKLPSNKHTQFLRNFLPITSRAFSYK